jgi:ATP-binding cassette subfamily B protein
MVADTLPQSLSTLITLTGCFTMMGILNFRLMLVVLGMLVVICFITYYLANMSRNHFKGLQKYVSDLNGFVEEMFSGQKVIKVFNHEDITVREFKEICEDLYKASMRTNGYASILFPVNGNLAYVAYALIAVVGAKFCIEGSMTLGVLASFLMYVRQFTGPIAAISQQFNGFMMALAGAERVFNLMDAEPELDYGIVELVNIEENTEEIEETEKKTHRWAWKIPVDPPKYVELKGDVRLDDVTFSYVEGKTVLKHISLYARPGQKIAFVGSTGAGKTTITNLLNRFYDIADGKIRYDGININKIKKSDLRRSLGLVLQETCLFTGTVMDNIRYGKLDATDEEIIAAAKTVNAHDFIMKLEKGYDTELAERGSGLSVGQRQLIAFARTILSDPAILILDEATSSIDTRNELMVQAGIAAILKGRTSFVIAHRLSTIRKADRIFVVDDGMIQEEGNHKELMDKHGIYYKLSTAQAV